MRFPIIRIKDIGLGGTEDRIVGTNSHDGLFIENNAIHYINIQCMCGTQGKEYKFTTRDDTPLEYTHCYAPQVEMMTLDEIIDMEMERLDEVTKNKIALYRMLKEKREKELEEVRKETGIGFDTSGTI